MKITSEHIKILSILALIICLAITATFFILQKGKKDALLESQAGKALSTVGNEAQYTDISGNPVSLEKYLGQTLVIHSWASWCPQCVDQLKLFSSIVSSLPETKLLAINRGEDGVTAERFLNYYELWSDVELLLDPTDYFYKSIEGYAMPETVIFDKNGSIIAHFRGVVSEDDIRKTLSEQNKN